MSLRGFVLLVVGVVAVSAAVAVGAGAAWFAATAWFAGVRGHPAPAVQPIAFNHKVHVQGEEMECTDCHHGNKRARSGLGDIRDCYECHNEPQGNPPSAADRKVMEYGEALRQIPWITVNRNPGHVYFSHRAHVAFGKMKCQDCHGDIGSRTEAVAFPNPRLHSMERCIECHRERKASLQCITCHK